jgi:hypothetical protein
MRRLLPVVVIAGLVFMTGCGFDNSAVSSGDDGDARSPGICRDHPTVRGDSHDLNGDGAAEVFKIFRCKAGPEPQSDQLEMFYGGSLDDDPAMLVMQYDHRVINRLCFDQGRAIYQWTDQGKPRVTQVTMKGKNKKINMKQIQSGCPAK